MWELFRNNAHPIDLDEKFHLFGRSNILNVTYWNFYFDQIENLADGLIVECGVGRGRSLIILLSLEEYYADLNSREKREVYGLDSFEGFPEPSSYDFSVRHPKKGEWSSSPSGKYRYSPEFLREVLLKSQVNFEKLHIISGFFAETLDLIPMAPISLLHLDGDLYGSYKAPLLKLAMRVQVGGLIVLDDFLREKGIEEDSFPGVRMAVEEFLSENDNFECLISMRGTPYLRRNS